MNPLALVGVGIVVATAAALFTSFSLIIACLVKTCERLMGVGQFLTMPLFFASNAIDPAQLMPGWVQVLARVNPLRYATDVLRALMLVGGVSAFSVGLDFAVLIAVTVALVTIGRRLYPTIAE